MKGTRPNQTTPLATMVALGFLTIALSAAARPGPKSPTDRSNTESALPAEATTDWWSRAQADIAAREYHLSWQERTHLPDGRAAWQAPNRAHNLRTYFTPEGVHLIPRAEGTPTWRWGMQLVSAGAEDSPAPVSKADLRIQGNRIEYRHGNLTGWYINNPAGIEQGFTLPAPLNETGRTVLRLELTGNLTANLHDGERLDLTTGGGVRVLEFGKLMASDAEGRMLETRFSLSGKILVGAGVIPVRAPG